MAERVVPRAAGIDERLAAAGLPALPRACWLEIDESALASNVSVVRDLVGPAVALNAVVKADAYGHGLVPAGRVFEQAGADRLCVASLDEALALRGAGVRLPILVLFPIPTAEIAGAARERIEVVVTEPGAARAALDAWRTGPSGSGKGELRIHLEVETGLSRGGVAPAAAADVAARIAATPRVALAGLWSHLATPEDERATARQLELFEHAVSGIRSAGRHVPPRHLAATGGIFSGRAPAYEAVRVGLALYGLLGNDLPLSAPARAAAARLRPAMALKCRALRIERLPAGTPVSYGGRWRAARESLIATLPVGYGDGLSRASSPGAEVLVRGRRVPLVGSVTMDAVMVDVTDLDGVGKEDEFVLLGSQNGDRITANEMSRVRTTIPWEVVTTMAHRVPRVYHAAAVLLGLRTLSGEARSARGIKMGGQG